MSKEYMDFLRAKMTLAKRTGFDVNDKDIHPWAKPHCRDIIRWACAGGQRGIFASFGLHKTVIQLEICRLALQHVGSGCGLIVCPLGVRGEFKRDAEKLGINIRFVRTDDEVTTDGLYMTNYESVREGKLDPKGFVVVSLDEAALLRGFGGTKTFREMMGHFEGTSTYRFVASATPDPNEYIELLAYAAFLGIMDVGEGKTRFFKRDSTKADKLTLYPHKADEFWLWVSSWAIFLQKPRDLGHSDDGYTLPPLEIQWHEVPTNHATAKADSNGQGRMFKENVFGLSEAAREKRDSLEVRVGKLMEIAALEGIGPDNQLVVWCDLNAEQKAIEKAFKATGIPVSSLYGTTSLDDREELLDRWRNRETTVLLTKPSMYGAGVNLQQCHLEVFAGIGFRFCEVIQACHRVHRFMQKHSCRIHFIFTEAEHSVKAILEGKWEGHKVQVERISEIIREHGLASISAEATLKRTIGVKRQEYSGERYRLINNDTVLETADLEENSVGLIITSIPFAFQYEYTPNYRDFGNTESNDHFWAQMDFLTPNLLRVLQPGRVFCCHVKDRIVPGGLTGLGFQTLHPFHAEAIFHYQRHGFAFLGMKTVVTDVVRENNQTYRLGWTEQCKDGSRMGCGVPEYVLLFRKPPTDRSNGYADVAVEKAKPDMETPAGETVPYDADNAAYESNKTILGTGYSRSRWQLDAHGFARSSGDRLLTTEELNNLPHKEIFRRWRAWSLTHVYDYEQHVGLGEVMDREKRLPATFMELPPASWHPDVWTDIARMRTLNMEQERKGQEMHLCCFQLDIVNRLIVQLSNKGDVVFDPFGGLMSVPYCAIKHGRYGIGVELNAGYCRDGAGYCRAAEANISVPTLFEMMEAESDDVQDGELRQATSL